MRQSLSLSARVSAVMWTFQLTWSSCFLLYNQAHFPPSLNLYVALCSLDNILWLSRKKSNVRMAGSIFHPPKLLSLQWFWLCHPMLLINLYFNPLFLEGPYEIKAFDLADPVTNTERGSSPDRDKRCQILAVYGGNSWFHFTYKRSNLFFFPGSEAKELTENVLF